MNKQTDNERLLADVLSPEADSGFSSALLARTLSQARRRRRVRQLRPLGGALVVLLAITMLISSQLRRTGKPGLLSAPQPANYILVVNATLSPGQIMRTRPLAPNQLVASSGTVPEIQTIAGGFREVGDDELMALAAPRVVALVRRGPHQAELIFVPSSPGDSDSQQN